MTKLRSEKFAKPDRALAEEPLDSLSLRADFPILSTRVHGHPLVYLDSAATTQKPRPVIDAIQRYYKTLNANIHRGVYQLSQDATAAYDRARRTVQQFVNATEPAEIIFTRGATESVNLVAASWGRANLQPGDEVIISAMEHHSNIVPWQIACELVGAKLRVIPMNDAGELRLDEYEKMLSPRTKMVAVVHLSNSLGTINDVQRIIAAAHRAGACTLVDGAQWVAHFPTDVRALDADFYVFSGHKLYGPTGIGVLYGKRKLLDAMPPYQGGGDMISSVSFEKTTYNELPHKFEAGTPNIEGAIALAAAIDYISAIGIERIAEHEHNLLEYATAKIAQVPGLRIIGTAAKKAGVISFVFEDPILAAQDVGMKLDLKGIAVRTGHHCCEPVMKRFCIPATTRASFGLYNSRADIDALVDALHEIRQQALANEVRLSSQSAPVAGSELVYPEPAADSPRAAADDLLETFEFLGEWPQRYEFILELGEKLPAFPNEARTEPNRVHGCQSTVHLIARKRPGTADVIDFLADSDAHIVRGLIAVLQKVYSGQRAGEILAFDVEACFQRLGLDQHLSMGRRNGLAGMVKRIRALAAELAG